MLKFIIFILVFNVLSFAEVQDFDIYEISDRKSVEKREPPPETLPEKQEPPQHIPQRSQNSDSVKKELNHKENSHSAASKTESAQTATKNENHEQIQKVNASKDQNAKPAVQEVSKAVLGNETTKNNATEPNFTNPKHAQHPGAALRGFYVFLGLSILIIIYFIFKAFRLRPGAPPPTTVRKYGIVGRRSDMEMLPLPLAEEEDDDTLFDMGTQINR